MPVWVIDTLKPKNGLDFPVVEAIDVAVEGYSSLADAVTHFATDTAIAALTAALDEKANTSDVNTAVANLQGQINQIVISASAESVVAPEVAAARVGDDGTSYQTLKERLDTENGRINRSLNYFYDSVPNAGLKVTRTPNVRLNGSGTVTGYTGLSVFSVPVNEGTKIKVYVKPDSRVPFSCQFQAEQNPSTTESRNIGAVVEGAIDDVIEVPSGAYYLLYTADSEDTECGILVSQINLDIEQSRIIEANIEANGLIGNNIFANEVYSGRISNSDGSFQPDDMYISTGFIPCKKNYYYIDRNCGYVSPSQFGFGFNKIAFYNKNKEFLKIISFTKSTSASIDDNAATGINDTFKADEDGYIRLQTDTKKYDASRVGVVALPNIISKMGDMPTLTNSIPYVMRSEYLETHNYISEELGYKIHPAILNGSLGNAGNPNAVHTSFVDVTGQDKVDILVQKPLRAEGNYYAFGYDAYNSSGERVVRVDFTKDTTNHLLSVEEGWAKIAYVICEFNSSGSPVANRDTDFGSTDVNILTYSDNSVRDYSSRVVSLEKYIPNYDNNIINRNRESECQLFAMSRYGYNANGRSKVNKRFSMLVSTDLHKSEKQMIAMMDYLNHYNGVFNMGVCLGDMASSNYSESDGKWYTDIVNTSLVPFFTVIGNHDTGNSTETSKSGTNQQVFDKWISPTKSIIGINNLSTTYYRRSFSGTGYNISVFVLNVYDVPDALSDSTHFAVNKGTWAVSQNQVDWFINELSQLPNDEQVIVLYHGFGDANTPLETIWTSRNQSLNGGYIGYDNPNIIPDIINAWKNGIALSSVYSPISEYSDILPRLSVDADFTNRGAGIFICYAVGHVHYDMLCSVDKYPDQKIVAFNTTAFDDYQSGQSDLPRVEDTKSENCITALTVNPDNRTVNLLRIGSDITFNNIIRKFYSFGY